MSRGPVSQGTCDDPLDGDDESIYRTQGYQLQTLTADGYKTVCEFVMSVQGRTINPSDTIPTLYVLKCSYEVQGSEESFQVISVMK